jgi:Zn-finger nucleic acid-binding protein
MIFYRGPRAVCPFCDADTVGWTSKETDVRVDFPTCPACRSTADLEGFEIQLRSEPLLYRVTYGHSESVCRKLVRVLAPRDRETLRSALHELTSALQVKLISYLSLEGKDVLICYKEVLDAS